MTNVNMTHCDVTVANRVLCESFQHIPVFFASSCCPFILLLFEKYFLKIQNFVFFRNLGQRNDTFYGMQLEYLLGVIQILMYSMVQHRQIGSRLSKETIYKNGKVLSIYIQAVLG